MTATADRLHAACLELEQCLEALAASAYQADDRLLTRATLILREGEWLSILALAHVRARDTANGFDRRLRCRRKAGARE